jgi:hypothetical protein
MVLIAAVRMSSEVMLPPKRVAAFPQLRTFFNRFSGSHFEIKFAIHADYIASLDFSNWPIGLAQK